MADRMEDYEVPAAVGKIDCPILPRDLSVTTCLGVGWVCDGCGGCVVGVWWVCCRCMVSVLYGECVVGVW